LIELRKTKRCAPFAAAASARATVLCHVVVDEQRFRVIRSMGARGEVEDRGRAEVGRGDRRAPGGGTERQVRRRRQAARRGGARRILWHR
jgi:hypothetical protein